MFIDNAKIYVKAGNGGNGIVSFHREKYIAAGGPDGGDGGRGGDIVFVANEGIRTLADFRYKRKYVADSGKDGQASNSSGRSGDNLIILVPVGTIVRNSATGRIIVDFVKHEQREIIAKGGKGGPGNQHFATPTRQVPEFAKTGDPGEELNIELELKLLADVGLVGFPNVGKSTLLSVISAARPKIANYHFTTLEPCIGVVQYEQGDSSFVVADIPGLIEGAHKGTGLGHEFLKHIERTRMLVHVIDISGSEGRDPLDDFEKINNELSKYSPILAGKKQIIAANKMDITNADEKYKSFNNELSKRGYEIIPISAATLKGVKELVNKIYEMLKDIPLMPVMKDEDIPVINFENEKIFNIEKVNGVFVVKGKWVQKLVGSVNTDSYESLQYFQRSIRKKGLIDELEQLGIQEGDTVKLYDVEFEYMK